MAIESIRCSVLGARVTRVVDLEGNVTQVICAEYKPDGTCALKKAALDEGPLAQLLDRASAEALSSRDVRCLYG